MSDWLADGLEASLASVPGSPERDHVLVLLRQARRIRLGADVTRAAADTVKLACDTIERHLDRLVLPAPVLWLEYEHAARAAAYDGVPGTPEAHNPPQTVGCLIACNPASPANVAVFVAWRFASGAIHHSYALLHWDRNTFVALAQAAPPRPDGASADRLFEAAIAAIPPGLKAELEIWQGYTAANHPWRELAETQTRRDATGEHLFLLAALLLLQSSAVSVERCVAPPPAPPPAVSRPANDDAAPVAPEADPETVQDGAPAGEGGGVVAVPGAAAMRLPRNVRRRLKRLAINAARRPANDPVPRPDPGGDGSADDADVWTASLTGPSRRWPWQSHGFRVPVVGDLLAWSPPAE